MPTEGTKTRAGRQGGVARASKLSPEERKVIATEAARSRWVVKATHAGVLTIGDIQIQCAVLQDGQRVVVQSDLLSALGRTGQPKVGVGESFELPPFLRANNLKPFIPEGLHRSSTPIVFKAIADGKERRWAYGYPAHILPDICSVFIDAKDADALHHNQEETYRRCKVLLRGFARVGVVALVDEATGYQAERERDELQRILAAYIAPELLPWTRRFPDEFFKQIYRLHNWTYNEGDTQGPRYVGKLINQYVYERLPQGVMDELRRLNPAIDGRRKYHHHRLLSDHTGHPHLDRHISQVVVLLRAARSKSEFKDLFERAFPVRGDQVQLSLPAAASEVVDIASEPPQA